MAVLRFNNLRLHRLTQSEGTTDEMGDYVPGAYVWEDVCSADIEPQGGKANIIKYDDGREVSYSYIVWLRGQSPAINVGERVKVTNEYGDTIAEAEVKGFVRYQLTCKVYL